MNSVINYCLGLGYYDLENFAGKNFLVVYNYIKNNSRVNPNDVLIPTIFTCIASDGQLTEGEWKFIASFIGRYSYNEALALAGEFYSSEAQEVVKKFIQSFPSEVRDAYIKMCIAVSKLLVPNQRVPCKVNSKSIPNFSHTFA